MPLPRLLLVIFSVLTLSACDLVEVVPPDEPPSEEPPPSVPVHPYGEGNGKVVFLSDLASAERINVTLGGEVIGAVTKFVGCPGRVTTDDSLATAIRPAGRYQYSAQSTTGLSWSTSTVTVTEDDVTRITFTGLPRQYAIHLPDEIAGDPVQAPTGAGQGLNNFHLTFGTTPSITIRVGPTALVQGDRFDIVFNGETVASNQALDSREKVYTRTLLPGPNYVAFRLLVDTDGDGTQTRLSLEGQSPSGSTLTGGAFTSLGYGWGGRWYGRNIRYVC